MMPVLARLPLLFVGAGLTIWGASQANDKGLDLAAWALMGSGLVMLGAWLAVEIQTQLGVRSDKRAQSGADEGE